MATTTTTAAGPVPAAPCPALLTKILIRRHYLPVAERTLDRLVSAGRFPRADVSIGSKIRLWRRASVERWISEQGPNAD